MDPLSITTACIGLIRAVTETTLTVTDFTRRCREARSDLTSINGELSQLQLVLESLRDDTAVSDVHVLPESRREQILSIIDSCSAVVFKIKTILDKHSGKTGALKWVTGGKNEVVGLRTSLEAYRESLSLALELVSVSMSKAIKNDTTAIRTDVRDIKQDTSLIPQILDELTRLRAIVAGGDFPIATAGQNYILQQYLDDLTSYAETVCNEIEWEAASSAHAISDSSSQSSAPLIQLDSSANTNSQACSVSKPLVNDKCKKTSSQPTGSGRTGKTAHNASQATNIIVLVGDAACGKTSLCYRLYKNTFHSVNVPTVVQEYDVHKDGNSFTFRDTSGCEDSDRPKPLSCRGSSLALICFAIDSPDSLANVRDKWISEVSHFIPDVPYILVGLKKDLRDDPRTIKKLKRANQKPVSWDQVIHPVRYSESILVDYLPQGNNMAKDIRAFKYIECSAKTKEGVREVLKISARQLFPRAQKNPQEIESRTILWPMKRMALLGIYRKRDD